MKFLSLNRTTTNTTTTGFRASVFSVFCLLVGCTTVDLERNTDTSQENADVSAIEEPWTAVGRLFIKTPTDSTTLRFTWEHISTDEDRIQLSGPLNLGATAVIRIKDQLLNESTGQTLAIASNSNASSFAALASQTPAHLWYQMLSGRAFSFPGIVSQVTQWQTIGESTVPRRIDATIGDATLKIAISQWQLKQTTDGDSE
ncbi:MAG: hypothetical protein L7S45_08205 [Luminiphilus sp.]|nr:hypothetical protein [Luminiphilus sp.]